MTSVESADEEDLSYITEVGKKEVILTPGKPSTQHIRPYSSPFSLPTERVNHVNSIISKVTQTPNEISRNSLSHSRTPSPNKTPVPTPVTSIITTTTTTKRPSYQQSSLSNSSPINLDDDIEEENDVKRITPIKLQQQTQPSSFKQNPSLIQKTTTSTIPQTRGSTRNDINSNNISYTALLTKLNHAENDDAFVVELNAKEIQVPKTPPHVSFERCFFFKESSKPRCLIRCLHNLSRMGFVYDIYPIDSILINKEYKEVKIQMNRYQHILLNSNQEWKPQVVGENDPHYFLFKDVEITEILIEKLNQLCQCKVIEPKSQSNGDISVSEDFKKQYNDLKILDQKKRPPLAVNNNNNSKSASNINGGSFGDFNSSNNNSISKPIGVNGYGGSNGSTKNSAYTSSFSKPSTIHELDLPSPIPQKKTKYKCSDELMIIYPVSNVDKDNKLVAQVRIIRGDLQRLNQEEFLNDKEAYREIKKWTGNEDIFQKDFIFVPINQSQHWSLMILCFPGESLDTDPEKRIDYKRRPCMLYLDSLYKKPGVFPEKLRSYLTLEWMNKKYGNGTEEKRKYTKDNYQLLIPHVPTQKNFSDCGVFLLHYIELFCKNPEKNFKNPLENPAWFKNSEIIQKRDVIKSLIFKLRKEQDPNAETEEEENKFIIRLTQPKDTTTYADTSSLEIVSPIEDFESPKTTTTKTFKSILEKEKEEDPIESDGSAKDKEQPKSQIFSAMDKTSKIPKKIDTMKTGDEKNDFNDGKYGSKWNSNWSEDDDDGQKEKLKPNTSDDDQMRKVGYNPLASSSIHFRPTRPVVVPEQSLNGYDPSPPTSTTSTTNSNDKKTTHTQKVSTSRREPLKKQESSSESSSEESESSESSSESSSEESSDSDTKSKSKKKKVTITKKRQLSSESDSDTDTKAKVKPKPKPKVTTTKERRKTESDSEPSSPESDAKSKKVLANKITKKRPNPSSSSEESDEKAKKKSKPTLAVSKAKPHAKLKPQPPISPKLISISDAEDDSEISKNDDLDDSIDQAFA
ncbi:hypothetical protein CYY_010025 [Polysphondylium violaceum]|uniref:Ubiquitin-like protease family profile domain-containing protein n=1 Tax=Polysphondylium violaceum TaxID=133409 RepID=A0A8J4PSI6_9MYCE|nr:hypothetical protein CYY_010025 [Polysphondylium violaceum]